MSQSPLMVVAVERIFMRFIWPVYQMGYRYSSMEPTAQDPRENDLCMCFYFTCFQFTHT